jgi:hypothetical protein
VLTSVNCFWSIIFLYLYNVTNYVLITKQWSKKCVFIFCNIITSIPICLVKTCDSWNVRAHRCCGIAYVPPSCCLCSNAPPTSLGNSVAIGRCRRYTVSHIFSVLGAHKNEPIDVSTSKLVSNNLWIECYGVCLVQDVSFWHWWLWRLLWRAVECFLFLQGFTDFCVAIKDGNNEFLVNVY